MELLLSHASKNGLCSRKEYEAILLEIGNRTTNAPVPGPMNLLVFGTGYDSPLWLAANWYGQTHFLENSPDWLRRCQVLPNVHPVRYNSRSLAKDRIHAPNVLHMDLPDPIEALPWDMIIVDGPYGKTQGRMKSIYNASRLARKWSERKPIVFVHDYERPTEKLYVDHFFKGAALEPVERLVKIQL